jgi:hypothetical protein
VDCRVPLGTLVDWSFDEDKIMVSCCCMHWYSRVKEA